MCDLCECNGTELCQHTPEVNLSINASTLCVSYVHDYSIISVWKQDLFRYTGHMTRSPEPTLCCCFVHVPKQQSAGTWWFL